MVVQFVLCLFYVFLLYYHKKFIIESVSILFFCVFFFVKEGKRTVEVMEMKRFSVMVKGHVQGVGFRSFVETEASHYKVTGNVRNEDNGNVAIEVQGKETELYSFIETIKQGNRFSTVEELSSTEMDTEANEQHFRTVY